MKAVIFRKPLLILAALVGAILLFTFSSEDQKVDFNTQIKPLFNKKCISCHGGVKRESDFSLLFRSEALSKGESGKLAIVPGDPENSELIRRVTAKDKDERMPYHETPLSDDEIKSLRNWIKQGAEWGDHWAYVPVKLPTVPNHDDEWIKSPIDQFIFDRFEEKELQPSTRSPKEELLRRVSLDVIGMPAADSLANAFLASGDAKSYEKLIDGLLVSPHYGERWAAVWLDLARYADTKGYERDDKRTIWRYRDWLIRAFNEDKPYDKFLIEQLAGDLLPDASESEFIATAFHRNTMTNDEGGTDNEEFRTAAVIDRVNTTWEALMGTTFACVQCHSHPYDPFKHEEYYKFMAFFNNTRDEDTFDDYPVLRHFSDTLQNKLSLLDDWLTKNASAAEKARIIRFVKTWQPAINSLTADKFVNSELSDTKWLAFRNKGECRLQKVSLDSVTTLIYKVVPFTKGGKLLLRLDSPTGPVIGEMNFNKTKGWETVSIPIRSTTGIHDIYLQYTNAALKNPEATGVMFDWFYFSNPLPFNGKPAGNTSEKLFWELVRANVPSTPIMMENPSTMHRGTNVFERGNWLVKGQAVTPETPNSLNKFPANAPRNRMGLAMWMTDKKNPLTARTMVNRVWEQLFGRGLVETLEDMGTQGAIPTHRELLDYLSYQFMNEFNWSVKKLVRFIMLSATYQQDSRLKNGAAETDLYNEFYARGPRVRLSAEQLRDQALFASGLLDENMYGKSVMPYQPDGLWQSPWSGDEKWTKSQGGDQYRRALYTYWKRTSPYPAMISFDGAAREVCTARRIRTNTPLQALVTLNDDSYIEMARNLAYMAMEQSGDLRNNISFAYKKVLYKTPSEPVMTSLENLYKIALEKYKKDPDRTCEMVGVMNERNNPETAARVVVMNAILNLDEVVTKN